MFICHVSTCANHKMQPQYCIICDSEEGNHDHKSLVIMLQGGHLKQEWHDLRSSTSLKAKFAKDWLSQYQGLMDELDR